MTVARRTLTASWRRRLVAWSVTLVFLTLPALVGLAGIASAPSASELELVESMVTERAAGEARSEVVRLYATAWLEGGEAHSSGEPSIEPPELSRARLVNLGAWFAIALLTYVSVATARGRIPAVGACLGLAGSGPVLEGGAFLRPEIPATLFGTMGIAIAIGLPVLLRRFRGRHPRRPSLWALLLPTLLAGAVIGVAFGLACSCVPRAGVYLLVPGGVLILATAVLLPGTMRLLRRVAPRRLPVVAWRWRILPWAIVSVGALGWVAWILQVGVQGGSDGLRGTVTPFGLVPSAWWLRLPLLALAGLGAVALVIGVGLRLGRVRRVTPDLVLTVWLVALLAQALLVRSSPAGAQDVTMAAPAFGALVGEGLSLVAWFAAGAVQTPVAAARGSDAVSGRSNVDGMGRWADAREAMPRFAVIRPKVHAWRRRAKRSRAGAQ